MQMYHKPKNDGPTLSVLLLLRNCVTIFKEHELDKLSRLMLILYAVWLSCACVTKTFSSYNLQSLHLERSEQSPVMERIFSSSVMLCNVKSLYIYIYMIYIKRIIELVVVNMLYL